ncbi:MAG: GNAT family N-acetyltransferase [Pseudomonadales bacterium]|nr:GNAT family N-acetyltransferase [Pseudomonadales bacterium]MCP5183761.1 GNAT family N-acetyltransferase [Pseudomonadales bacterium]
MIVTVVRPEDDLARLVAEINSACWDAANAMDAYDVDSLAGYLSLQGTVFVTCHDDADGQRRLLGMASARIEVKPYGGERWLYVDEVDVCADQRQRGAGGALMNRLLAIARETGCEEVWLGTEPDNHAANALYRSLHPADVAEVVGYTFALAHP